jgi:hypothetical protein
MALNSATPHGSITISGVSLNTPAWRVLDLTDLWLDGRQRGKDRLVPGAAGVVANMRRRTVTEVDLPMVIIGDCDQTGAAHTDSMDGLWRNVDYLNDNVCSPTGTGDGTRAAVLTLPSGTTLAESVHVLGLELGASSRTGKLATLTLSIPSGKFQ